MAEVSNFWVIGGGVDYLMCVLVQNVHAYQRMRAGLLDAKIETERYFIYIVTKVVKPGPDNISQF